jgi:hypothetical protein
VKAPGPRWIPALILLLVPLPAAGAFASPLAAEATATAIPGTGTATAAVANPSAGLLTLSRTDRTLPISGDPIWELHLALPGQKLRSYEAVVGRKDRQNADRERLGGRAPLPKGRYRITDIGPLTPEDPPELGRLLWIGLEPQFRTKRKGFGIHHDPSAGSGRRSGTNGCIGLIHGNDLLVLGDLLARSGTRELEVQN